MKNPEIPAEDFVIEMVYQENLKVLSQLHKKAAKAESLEQFLKETEDIL